MSSTHRVADAVPTNSSLSDAERHAIVEIAAIAVSVDHAIHRDETASLRKIAATLGVDAAPELTALFAQLGQKVDKSAASDRLVAAAARLGSVAAREVAYKAACRVMLVDLNASEEESAFDRELVAVLALSEDDAVRLRATVTSEFRADAT